MKKEYRIKKDTLPQYVGGKATVMDAADGIDLLLVEETTKGEYESFCDSLKAEGYTVYVTRILNGNIYTTFTKGETFVHTHYAPSNATVKVTMGDACDLPVRKEDAIIKNVCQPKLTFVAQRADKPEHEPHTDIGLSVVFTLSDGRLIVLDGGMPNEKNHLGLLNAMREASPDKDNIVIAGWYLSHAHIDHHGAAWQFILQHLDKVKIEAFVLNYAADTHYENLTEDSWKKADDAQLFRGALEKISPDTKVIKAHSGQVYYYGEEAVEIVYSVEDYYPEPLNYNNSSSLVLRLHAKGNTVMLLADTTHTSGARMMELHRDALKSDMVQIAHHGMWASYSQLYRYINAPVLLWPSNLTNAKKWFDDSVVQTAVGIAEDVYLSGNTEDTVLTFPYEIKHNKADFLKQIEEYK
jgi:hypothetical protein